MQWFAGGGTKHVHAAADSKAQEQAEEAKAAGNSAFSSGDFDAAVRHYSAAIQADPAKPVYHSNRAAAHLKVGWGSGR